MSRLRKRDTKLTQLENALFGQSRFNPDDLERECWVAGFINSPRSSAQSLEQSIPNYLHAIVARAGYKLNEEQTVGLVNGCPSCQSIAKMMEEASNDSLLSLLLDVEETKALFLASDKGWRKGIDHLVKILSFWDDKNACVKSRVLDIDGA
eukprot:scaffold229680_cov61-Attheya_sp.AAC.1